MHAAIKNGNALVARGENISFFVTCTIIFTAGLPSAFVTWAYSKTVYVSIQFPRSHRIRFLMVAYSVL